MNVNINELNQAQLNELIDQAESRKKEIRHQRIKQLRDKIHTLIQDEGYTFEDVFGGKRKAPTKIGKVPPKYRNPNNPQQTWSGRGKQPNWFKEAMAQGYSRDAMLIV